MVVPPYLSFLKSYKVTRFLNASNKEVLEMQMLARSSLAKWRELIKCYLVIESFSPGESTGAL